MQYRTEHDTLGPVSVPVHAYWGAQTQRALDNFPISGKGPAAVLVRAYALVKKAAAELNQELGFLDAARSRAIVQAADEVLAGRFASEFVVDPFQAGAGTSQHMNVNEVLANRANELLGGERGRYEPVHPNDHVNLGQSTNDTFPAALRVALLLEAPLLQSALDLAIGCFQAKAAELDGVATSARTHLQDAVPIRLGQEFLAFAGTLVRARQRLEEACRHLRRSNLGATAAGTGLNSHPEYHHRVVARLGQLSGLPIETAESLIEIAQSTADFAWYSAALRSLAMDLDKIASDLRLLASGPSTGLYEIRLPAVQPGSSIMPGKVNPSILECVNQICLHVIGLDSAVSAASRAGQLQLNVMMPVMAHELIEMQGVLRGALIILAEKCVAGIQANEEICRRYFEGSAALATVLNPLIGYEAAAALVKAALAERKTILALVRERGILTETQIAEAFSLRRLTEPGVIAPGPGKPGAVE